MRPVFGLPVQIPNPKAGVVLVFFRHLGCPFARAAVGRLQAAFADFDRAGIQVVGSSHCSLAVAQDFVPRHHILFPLLCDADGGLRARFGVGQNRQLVSELGDLRTGPLLEALAFGRGLSRGDETELPAELVIGADGLIRYARYPRSITALPDMGAILRCAALG